MAQNQTQKKRAASRERRPWEEVRRGLPDPEISLGSLGALALALTTDETDEIVEGCRPHLQPSIQCFVGPGGHPSVSTQVVTDGGAELDLVVECSDWEAQKFTIYGDE